MAYNILTGEKRNTIYLLMELYSTACEVVLPKKIFLNINLIKLLDLTTNL